MAFNYINQIPFECNIHFAFALTETRECVIYCFDLLTSNWRVVDNHGIHIKIIVTSIFISNFIIAFSANSF